MNTRITALRYWALLCFAAGVALVAACGGGSNGSSGNSELPLPPETTAYEAQTSVKLAFTPSAAGAGAAPLRFELAAAPDGVQIDEQSGSVEWVPQHEQLGDHAITVAITAANGAVTTKSYRVSVAAPAGQAAYLVLRTDATSAPPGQAVRTTWRIGGEMPANAALQIRAHAPAVDAAAADASQMSWWLDAQGAWSATEVQRGTPQRQGEVLLAMPTAMTGLWSVELRMLDETGKLVAIAAQRLFIADTPALRLVLNRPLANTLDRVEVDLDVAVPSTAGAVRLMAWLVKPNGSVLGLPGMTASDLELQRGEVIASGRQRLLDAEFTPGEEGDYRLHARLYAAADGRLLAEASRRFDICNTPSTMSGVVRRPDRSRLDGTVADVAAVQALDLDDGGVTASALVAADGSYQLALAPGRYVLMARVIDAAGASFGAESPLHSVGCTPAAAVRELNLTAR